MTPHSVKLGAETFALRLSADGLPLVYTATGRPKWTVERLGPRTFRFMRIVRDRLEIYIDSLPMPEPPPPCMPRLPRRVPAKRLNQEIA